MTKIISITLFVFLLLGCSSTKPPVTEYKIRLTPLEFKSTSVGCKEKSLKVSQAFSSSSLMSLGMKYAQDEHKIYTYSQAQWNNSPNQEISSQVVKTIRESKLFKTTQNSKSRSRSDLILEINIEDFMQYYNKNINESHSSVVISLALIDAQTSKVLASKTFSAKSNVDTLDASGGVKALDSALQDTLTHSLEFLNEVCK